MCMCIYEGPIRLNQSLFFCVLGLTYLHDLLHATRFLSVLRVYDTSEFQLGCVIMSETILAVLVSPEDFLQAFELLSSTN